MRGRIHPGDSPSVNENFTTAFEDPEIPEKPTPPMPDKPVPTPGTYVSKSPKTKSTVSRRRKTPTISKTTLAGEKTAGTPVVPKAPIYSVEKVSVRGFNLALSSLTVSPEFDFTVKAENPNKKIGIFYEKGSFVTVSHSNVKLCTGAVPAFYQPSNNVTIFRTALKGSGIKLTSQVHGALTEEQRGGKIPLGLNLRVPVRIKVASVKSWTVSVMVKCDITVDMLTENSSIISKDCDVNSVTLFSSHDRRRSEERKIRDLDAAKSKMRSSSRSPCAGPLPELKRPVPRCVSCGA
ncbi:hypothetical protein HHK36_019557 [Tetracentron sinense]|uniref:Late embryogenesis abundant protein LEA-2 subgroup domain-containing protein n=1 Tax=Tetracentron sinense TaxID=13715 RepID=A0A834YWJ5_TETSI|nr:hypothetical protein HHK36_019557 [Tetracentron sinense]